MNTVDPIAEFWRRFARVQAELWTLTSADHPVYDALLEQLQVIHEGLYLEFSTGPGEPELIVTAEGDSSLFPLVESIVAAAPEMPGWRILALKPKTGFPATTCWEGLTITLADVVFCPLERPGTDDLGLRMLVPGIGPDESESAHNALLRALDHGLGERAFADAVHHTEVLPLPDGASADELIALVHLEEYIRSRQRRG